MLFPIMLLLCEMILFSRFVGEVIGSLVLILILFLRIGGAASASKVCVYVSSAGFLGDVTTTFFFCDRNSRELNVIYPNKTFLVISAPFSFFIRLCLQVFSIS